MIKGSRRFFCTIFIWTSAPSQSNSICISDVTGCSPMEPMAVEMTPVVILQALLQVSHRKNQLNTDIHHVNKPIKPFPLHPNSILQETLVLNTVTAATPMKKSAQKNSPQAVKVCTLKLWNSCRLRVIYTSSYVLKFYSHLLTFSIPFS